MKTMPPEQELLEMKMQTGETVQQMIDRLPDDWRSAMIAGAYECLKRGWPLHDMNIQAAWREITREEKTKKQRPGES